ncbi:MAG: hypothetical protein LUG50_08765, partial [Planctomycetaceae bacterium]|nr:hypothetical protein [Planctomycetaceae bacterium]
MGEGSEESVNAFRPARGGRTVREWLVRLVILLLGLTVAHLGVTLFILPALGSDPFTIFVQGWARVFSVSVGTAHVALTILLMVAMLLTTKGYVLPGT